MAVQSVPTAGQAEFPATSFQIDTAHTGGTFSASLRLPLQPIYWIPLGFGSDPQNSFPIIAAGKLLLLGTGILFAWNQDTLNWFYDGGPAWADQFSGDNTSFRTVAYDAGTIYFNSALGPLRALDAQTGAHKWFLNWRATYGGSCSNTSLIAKNGIVYFAGGYWATGERVFAVRGSDGTVLWSKLVPGAERAHMALTNEGLYISTFDVNRHVYKFDPATGTERWHRQYDPSTAGIPAVYDNIVYLRSQTGIGKRLDAGTGLAWSGDIPAMVGPAFHSGRMYYHLNGNTLTARDTATNTDSWQATSPVPFGMPPLVVNGNVFTFHDGGTINAWSGTTGAKVWSDTISWLSPAAAMGTPADFGNAFAPRACAAGDGLLVVVFKNDVVVYASTIFSLTDPPTTVNAGDSVTTDWLVPGGRSKTDWVGLYRKGADNRDWLAYRYTNGTTIGTANFTAPLTPGEYEFRYLLDNSYNSVESSSAFTVNAINATLNITPSSGTAGGTVYRLDFTAPPGRPGTDWIGFYKVGDPNSAYRWWRYSGGSTSGSFSLGTLDAGEYEARYLLDNGYDSIAVSNRVTVTSLDPAQFTLTASPSTVPAGGALSISFTAPAGRDPRDWIGLYRVGDPENRNYLWWSYTNGAESGTLNLTAPMIPGQYEFRYLLEDRYTSIKASNTVTAQ